jgi:hypothetical protein
MNTNPARGTREGRPAATGLRPGARDFDLEKGADPHLRPQFRAQVQENRAEAHRGPVHEHEFPRHRDGPALLAQIDRFSLDDLAARQHAALEKAGLPQPA